MQSDLFNWSYCFVLFHIAIPLLLLVYNLRSLNSLDYWTPLFRQWFPIWLVSDNFTPCFHEQMWTQVFLCIVWVLQHSASLWKIHVFFFCLLSKMILLIWRRQCHRSVFQSIQQFHSQAQGLYVAKQRPPGLDSSNMATLIGLCRYHFGC